jgi:hypothetical protein
VLRFNRINDLNATGALFHNTGGRAMIDLPLDDDQALQAEVGARHYSDGNVSRELYLQYQRRLSGNGTTWVAVQPHLYAEQWDRTSPAYFSPDLHATVGVTLRAIADRRSWTVDTAVTPQALFSSGREGVGAMLSGGLTRRIGRGSAGANVLWFSDRRYRFNLWHLSGEVRIPVGK